jgi:hypothetical protein
VGLTLTETENTLTFPQASRKYGHRGTKYVKGCHTLVLQRLISFVIDKKESTKTADKKMAACHVGPRQVHIFKYYNGTDGTACLDHVTVIQPVKECFAFMETNEYCWVRNTGRYSEPVKSISFVHAPLLWDA